MATVKKRGFDIDDVPDSGNQGNARKPADMVDLYALPEKKYLKLRFFGDIFAYGGHWVKVTKKDGKEGSFFQTCAAFDTETGKLDSTKHCAFCDHGSADGLVRFALDYFSNAISRKEQQNAPERIRATAAETESGFKSKDSESFTPVKAIRLTNSVLRRLKELRQLNVHENAEGDSMNYSVMQVKYGVDLQIKKDKDLPPANQYDVQMGAHAPMKKEERAYLIWDLSELMITPSAEDTAKEYAKWAAKMGLGQKEDDEPKKKKAQSEDFDDEDDEPKKPASKSKKVVDEDDEDDEPPVSKKKPTNNDFDDEDDEPKSKPASKSKKVVDDEDDEPVSKKPTSKKSAAIDEDDDFDDEPKKKPASKKPVVDEDDDFDDEPKKPAAKKVVDEDDEDDEPPVAKKKPAAKKVEDDEDDEPKKKPAAKSKKAVVDDDFED